ncbi:nuclear transport factor 2 family protein [Olivibacter jilunii]|uniref:nuclear transport factor 2 family protein n=1 Tax=Olivibacter jilunii TaxID=985016 RepID=UPI003F147353
MKKINVVCLIVVFFICIKTVNAQSLNSMEKTNKVIIENAFKKWADGTGNFFDLLHDDVKWTITGTSAISKVYYNKKQFIDEAIVPLNKRFKVKIVPEIKKLYVDGSTVIAIWDGKAIASDGLPYDNTYSWYMTMKDGKIIEAVAFFDTITLDAIWYRVK